MFSRYLLPRLDWMMLLSNEKDKIDCLHWCFKCYKFVFCSFCKLHRIQEVVELIFQTFLAQSLTQSAFPCCLACDGLMFSSCLFIPSYFRTPKGLFTWVRIKLFRRSGNTRPEAACLITDRTLRPHTRAQLGSVKSQTNPGESRVSNVREQKNNFPKPAWHNGSHTYLREIKFAFFAFIIYTLTLSKQLTTARRNMRSREVMSNVQAKKKKRNKTYTQVSWFLKAWIMVGMDALLAVSCGL